MGTSSATHRYLGHVNFDSCIFNIHQIRDECGDGICRGCISNPISSWWMRRVQCSCDGAGNDEVFNLINPWKFEGHWDSQNVIGCCITICFSVVLRVHWRTPSSVLVAYCWLQTGHDNDSRRRILARNDLDLAIPSATPLSAKQGMILQGLRDPNPPRARGSRT